MTKHMGGAALILAAAATLTGCGASADDTFTQQWKQLYPNANMTTAIPDAHSICDSLKAGTRYQDELMFLQQKIKSSTPEDAANFVRVATSAYCPEYKDLH